jgi:hypothetical protein
MNFIRTIYFAVLLAGAVSLLATAAYSHDLMWPGEKLKSLFPQAESFEQKNLYVSDEQKAALEKALGSRLPEEDMKPSIYLAVVRSAPDGPVRKAAALMFVDAHGENGKIEMGVVVSGKGDLVKVQLFENKESEMLSQTAFLSQFAGKAGSDSFRVGADIKAPAGQEKSAQAVASGARRGMLIINEMFRKK